MTFSQPFGKLGLTIDGRNAYLTMEGGAFKLFMAEKDFSALMSFLRASRDDRVLSSHHVTLTIASPWHDGHLWTFLPGAARYGSDAPGTASHAELVPADRDRLITTWDSHIELVAFGEKAAADPEPPAAAPEAPAPSDPPAAPDAPQRVSLPVIK